MAETVVLPPETPAGTDVLAQVPKARLLAALRRVRNGDFEVRLPLDGTGIAGEIAQAFNDVVDLNERMAREFTPITVVVGREGRVGQRATLGPVSGSWAGCVDSINTLIDDALERSREVVQAPGVRGSTAVALAEGSAGHDGHRPPLRTDEASGAGRQAPASRPLSPVACRLSPENGTPERVLLILEDDADLARFLRTSAHEHGFKAVVAADAETAVALAHRLHPDVIALDATEGAGWWVLDHLKHDPRTRHIPIHVITAAAEGRRRALDRGAVTHGYKPVTAEALGRAFAALAPFVQRDTKTLLVVAGDEARRRDIVEVIGDPDAGDVQVTAVGSSAQALAALDAGRIDLLALLRVWLDHAVAR